MITLVVITWGIITLVVVVTNGGIITLVVIAWRIITPVVIIGEL